jgi:hypothetical protein
MNKPRIEAICRLSPTPEGVAVRLIWGQGEEAE